MVILSVINKATGSEVLQNYTNRELKISECVFITGKPLFIRYAKGSYFKHEKVIKVTYPTKNSIIVETIYKIWNIGDSLK